MDVIKVAADRRQELKREFIRLVRTGAAPAARPSGCPTAQPACPGATLAKAKLLHEIRTLDKFLRAAEKLLRDARSPARIEVATTAKPNDKPSGRRHHLQLVSGEGVTLRTNGERIRSESRKS